MALSSLLKTLWCIVGLVTLHAMASSLQSDLVVRTPAGQSADGVIHAIRRELGIAALNKRDRTWKNSTTIAKSWNNDILLQLDMSEDVNENLTINAGVEIVCTQCYLKGMATAELSISDDFNITGTITNITDSLADDVKNLTKEAYEFAEDYTKDSIYNLFHSTDIEYPTFNYSFNLDVPPVKDALLRFTFDGLELYVQVDTLLSLGATYTIPLFNSAIEAPEALIGFYLTEQMQIGLIFKIDLILSVKGEIDISSGFHLRFEDGFAIDIALFDNDLSRVTNNGGHFEFLPVQIESAGITFSAVLRLSVHAGVTLATPDVEESSVEKWIGDFKFDDLTFKPQLGGGIEVGVFANIAEFTTDVSLAPESPDCKLELAQSYQFALGASAGATINIGGNIWGPTPTTTIPIFTAAVSACAIQRTSSTTVEAQRRQDMSTATLTTTAIYTGVNCLSTGFINCPASLQNTSTSTGTKTTTVVVTSGEEPTWPMVVQATVASLVPFGDSAVGVPRTTGSPVSYTAPPSPTATGILGDLGSALEGDVNGTPKKEIVGISVGVGVPVLLALIVGIMLVRKRRSSKGRRHIVPQAEMEDEVVHMSERPKESEVRDW